MIKSPTDADATPALLAVTCLLLLWAAAIAVAWGMGALMRRLERGPIVLRFRGRPLLTLFAEDDR